MSLTNRILEIVESSLTSSFELLEVFVDEMFAAEIYLLISSTVFTRWNVDLTLTLTLTLTVWYP